MWISHLKIDTFRNYQRCEIDFEGGINLIVGSNGTGKTSLMEAIAYLPLLKSFRTNDDNELIHIGDDYAVISARVENVGNYFISISKKGKMVTFDNQKVLKISSLAGKSKAISFLPHESELFKESPEERRKFIDVSLMMISKAYLNELSKYRYYLKNLRESVKSGEDEKYIDVLIKTLSESGYALFKMRSKFVNQLNQELTIVSRDLSDDDNFIIKYLPEIDALDENDYYLKIKKELTILGNKVIVKGIHHDDINVLLNDLSTAKYASQGQNRLGVIALKLSLAQLIAKYYKDDPLIILDDVLSELDSYHQTKLLEYLKKYQQVFITNVEEMKGPFNVYKIENNHARRIK